MPGISLLQYVRVCGNQVIRVTKLLSSSRWADGRPERLPKLAAELVALQVTAIVVSVEAALALKAVTTSIPIVFVTGADPVAAGLVSSISRPGGNITGVSFFDIPVTGKRLALLRELVPNAEIIAVLQDANFSQYQTVTREIEATAGAMGQKIVTLNASRPQEIDAVFATMVQSGVGALLVGPGPFLSSRHSQVIGLAALNAIPTSYFDRGSVDAGGLISYGSSQTDAYRRAGIYVARILKGREAGRSSCRVADTVRAGHQPQDCQGTRSYCAASANSPRRRGDPMNR